MSGNKQSVFTIVGVSTFLVVAFIHLVNWDTHSIAIIPLKTGQILGMSSTESLRKISQICTERLKYACAEEALSEVVRSTESGDDYFNLATLQRKLGHHKLAIANYNNSLVIENKSSEPSTTKLSDIYFGLARSYDALGDSEAASRSYAQAIEAKPNVIQITVTESYIAFLKKQNNLELAKKVVNEARKRGNSDRLFAGIL